MHEDVFVRVSAPCALFKLMHTAALSSSWEEQWMAAGSSWELGMSGQVEAPRILHWVFSQSCVCVSEAGDAVRDGKQALITSALRWDDHCCSRLASLPRYYDGPMGICVLAGGQHSDLCSVSGAVLFTKWDISEDEHQFWWWWWWSVWDVAVDTSRWHVIVLWKNKVCPSFKQCLDKGNIWLPVEWN